MHDLMSGPWELQQGRRVARWCLVGMLAVALQQACELMHSRVCSDDSEIAHFLTALRSSV